MPALHLFCAFGVLCALPPQTYIGRVLVAVNPYKQLGVYGAGNIKNYRGRYIFEEPPHVRTLASCI